MNKVLFRYEELITYPPYLQFRCKTYYIKILWIQYEHKLFLVTTTLSLW